MMFADHTQNTRRRPRALGWVGCLLLVMALIGLSHQNLFGAPAVYYTATTGSDSNPGTSAAPFRTLGKGVSVLTPGDTLLVAPGIYAEALTGNIPSGTSWTAPVTLKALDPAARPVIRPSSGGPLHFQGQQYIIVDGFVLDGVTETSENAVKITVGGGLPAAHHIRIANSEIKNAPRSGVLTTNAADYNEFINLDVHDNGTNNTLDHGLYLATSYNLVERCRVHNNAAYGVHVYQGTANMASGNIVRNNLIYGNNGPYAFGIILSSGAGNQAYNNVIRGNTGGIQVDYGAPQGTLIYNNTIYANSSSYAIYIGSESSGAVVRNNILYRNSSDSITDNGASTTTSNNLMGTDPRFVNEAQLDLRLQSASSAVDGGMTLAQVTTDFDGTARPQGVRYDIGAYEYKAGAPAAPTNLRIVP